jgi:hypothetical protein
MTHINYTHRSKTLMLVIFMGAFWLWFLLQLQHDVKTKELSQRVSASLKVIALELTDHGWKHNNRIL